MNPSAIIDKEIARHPDWRGRTMGDVRRIIRETVPDVTEEVKWMGTPTWSREGILCICNAFKNMVKVTFYNGASLGMDGLFNAELGGSKWRAIKYFEGDTVNESGMKKLLLAAVAFNAAGGKGKAKPATAKAKPASANAKAKRATAAGKTPKRAKAAVKPKRAAARGATSKA